MNKKITCISIALIIAALGVIQLNSYAEPAKCNMQTLRQSTMEYVNNKDYNKALNLLNACVAENPKDANLYNNRGNILMELGKFNEAALDYQKSININPKSTAPYNGLATVYMKTGEIDKGLEILLDLKEIAPNDIIGALNRASFELLLKNYNAAIEDYTIALKDKKNSIYYKDRAYAYLANSNPEKAIADYESYFKAGHESGEAYKYLAIAYEVMGNNDKALEYFRKAAELYRKENNIEEYNSLMRIFKAS